MSCDAIKRMEGVVILFTFSHYSNTYVTHNTVHLPYPHPSSPRWRFTGVSLTLTKPTTYDINDALLPIVVSARAVCGGLQPMRARARTQPNPAPAPLLSRHK